MTTINFNPTVVGIGRTERDAIAVKWSEIERFLGRPHNGNPEDDRALIAALQSAGAPSWVGNLPLDGTVDEQSWFLLGAELDPADDEHYWDDED